MGGKCPSRKVKKRRFSHKTARRTKFLLKGDDEVYNELLKQAEEAASAKTTLPIDEDLPGMGQFYCLHCDRYFASEEVLEEHFRSKRHKKRMKQMMGPAPHTQQDAELAAGMGMPDNGPKLMSM
ncbi:zinc finger C2H2 protein [Canna indica]|uniref:Zinc finger C2H2 protein n=1 Tax=Canna indica TaxID=4628 RepID=A0AAQ3KR72_9LILI|nr:zinc finger C2H2 protein [Canna indica]